MEEGEKTTRSEESMYRGTEYTSGQEKEGEASCGAKKKPGKMGVTCIRGGKRENENKGHPVHVVGIRKRRRQGLWEKSRGGLGFERDRRKAPT